jgi:hypothetical protein
MSGPTQGTYTASLDNITIGNYTAHADVMDYNHLLFAAHGLKDGEVHYLSFENTNDGLSLAFDYAVVTTSGVE